MGEAERLFTREEFLADVADRLGEDIEDLPEPARSVLGQAAGAIDPCAALPAVIRHLVDEWGQDPCDINLGECAVFADAARDHVPDAKIIDNVEWNAQLRETDRPTAGVGGEHAWLECGGRFYDSETPEGVDDWRDLPFFQQHFAGIDLSDAFIKQTSPTGGQVAEEGVWVPSGLRDDGLDDGNTVWLEYQLIEGRGAPWGGESIERATRAVAGALDRPARDLWPHQLTTRPTVLRVYFAIDPERASVERISSAEEQVRVAFRGDPAVRFDRMAVAGEDVVANAIGPL